MPAEAGAVPTTAADIDNEAGSSGVDAPAAETGVDIEPAAGALSLVGKELVLAGHSN